MPASRVKSPSWWCAGLGTSRRWARFAFKDVFPRPGNAHAVARAVADVREHLLGEVRDVDHRLAAAGGGQAAEVPVDERLAAGLHQRLRRALGERPQPLAASGGEDHRLHAACSSSSNRASGPSSLYLLETERA